MISNRHRRRLNRFRRILGQKLRPHNLLILQAKTRGVEPDPAVIEAGRKVMQETMRRYDHLLDQS